ncbi:ABC-F family ATP-binding cassette domain-containing protein [Azospirillum rugosum]|uniref:ATPase subunit of ABC transporter with duplicated ATPase domains n=1 Tax=Azospirillum rugosum TaxID=416170 RepID=A0ABS4SUC6_9PROT|nr:ABC-F family ATP-binding cassette domain-containing protein [Azospirillum rugosum]MBP2296166.1 ATPase subunit of ABC transporter with duplicated ATPase domains [Azospirillum rugosum]MDQ0527149.1 ATPase subunit of ABC transporter with duplicated ATPase domains [Azospirillum rugosum]
MASITLTRLSWSTPDGRRVLSDLDLAFGRERTGLVGRNGTGKTTLLKLIAGELRPLSGNISVNGTLGVLKQVVQPGERETVADLFGATAALATLRRAEAGLADADELAGADWTLAERIAAALGRVGLDAGPDTRLAELSGGQRTRASLAAAVFAEPDVLLLDEPTNNLDRDGREAVASLLAGWRAGAIVVSHDRALLDRMDAIVELTSLGAARYGGNWTLYRERKAAELAAARQDLAHAEKTAAEVDRRAQRAAERKDRRDAAGSRKGDRGDLPRILLGGRKNRAEASRGDAAKLAGRQRAEAGAAVEAARSRIEILRDLSVTLPPTGLPANRTVLRLDGVTAGYDAEHPVIRDLSLSMVGPERVAVVGPNGSGKTTLLNLIAGRITPIRGTVSVAVGFAMLDQRVGILDPAASILDNFLRLNPGASENACRATLARFLFRADAALQPVGTLSGGQTLRAGLACALGGPQPPSLLLLDEPTNHLDVESIEAVEAGLASYDGALLLVSHDEAFLANLGVGRRLDLSLPPAPFNPLPSGERAG